MAEAFLDSAARSAMSHLELAVAEAGVAPFCFSFRKSSIEPLPKRYRTTIRTVRKLFVSAALWLALPLPGQGLQWRQTLVEKIRQSAPDLNDSAVLDRTLYAPLRPDDLGVEQCAQMVEAATRRVARIEEKIAEARPLVEQGIYARNEIPLLEEELAERRRTLDLAVSRADFIRQLADMAHLEASFEPPGDDPGPRPLVEHFDGRAPFTAVQVKKVTLAFLERFGKPLPVSASGDTPFHRALGFDHRGRVDVALSPDQPEGVWLREFLSSQQIPFYAFRGPASGRSSAAHIHIGPPSARLRVAD